MKLAGAVVGAALAVALGAGTAQAQFPNTYKTTMTTDYNPNVGSIDPAAGKTPGTLQITITFSGSTTQQAMNNSGVHHTPHALAKVNGSPQSQVGPGFLPAQNMGWSYTFSFDLQASGCDFQVLEAGTCTIEDDSFVTCPMMGDIGLPEIHGHVEAAITRVSWNPSTHQTTPYCDARSSPPDYSGPLYVPTTWTDPTTGQGPAGFMDWESIGTSLVINGSSQNWIFPPTYDKASGRNVSGTYPPILPDCTNSAAGIFPPVFPF